MEAIGVCRPYRFVSTAKIGVIFETTKKIGYFLNTKKLRYVLFKPSKQSSGGVSTSRHGAVILMI